jgi:carbonic anhydrase
MISAMEALERLRAGNRRFVEDATGLDARLSRERRGELVEEQAPFAVILGCSDSRVPVELVFDQGLGDLFVIRVAGNIVAPSQTGSVEFAAEKFGVRLVVVLGHNRCGAIRATVEALQQPGMPASRNLSSIVERIRPSVETLLSANPALDPEALMDLAVRANVRAAAERLRRGSAILERLIAEDGLLVVGAEYALESGRVDFFDGVSA